MSKTGLIIGATGMVGSALYPQLIPYYDRLYVVARRELPVVSSKVEALNFDQATDLKVDDFFNCLGTTIKKAGSQEKFESIDIGIPLKILQNNTSIKRVLNISSVGADKASSNFYLKCKGRLESEFQKLHKELIVHYRPSTLDGPREEKRPLEQLGLQVSRILRYFPVVDRYAPTPVQNIVTQVLADIKSNQTGIIVRDSAYLNQIRIL